MVLKMNEPLNPLYVNFKRSLFYYSLHSDDVKDVIKLKPVLFQGMKKKEIAAFLMICAREAYAAHFPDKEKAEDLAIYRAGLWYSLITGHTKPLTIEVALGVMDRHYGVVKMQAEFEILDGNPSLLRNAYDDFLKAIKQKTKI